MRTPALVALFAGLLTVLGSLLPWAIVEATLRGGVVARDVVLGSDVRDGRLTFAFAWIAVAAATSILLPPKAGWWMAPGIFALFLSTVIVTALNLGDLDGFADGRQASVAPGVGLSLAFVSSLVGLGAAGWMIIAEQARWRTLVGTVRDGEKRGDGAGTQVAAVEAEPAIERGDVEAEREWEQGRVYPAAAALASAVLAALGNLGPWATGNIPVAREFGFTTTISGGETNGGRVALVLLMMAAGTLVLRLLRPATRSWSLWLAMVYMALAALVAGLNWANVEGLVTDEGAVLESFVDPGWGLVLGTVAAAVGVGCCLWGIMEAVVAPKQPPPG